MFFITVDPLHRQFLIKYLLPLGDGPVVVLLSYQSFHPSFSLEEYFHKAKEEDTVEVYSISLSEVVT